jgi:hypothetical protein
MFSNTPKVDQIFGKLKNLRIRAELLISQFIAISPEMKTQNEFPH